MKFILSKPGSRTASAPNGEVSASVSGDARKLSLRALLHNLWHAAELTSGHRGG
ncbi:DUF1173 domain-containing protein, partial [Mesorhizobium camelthorni]|nr:DUF1173 domain-containing protein [Mesorhizobium camelthorni]